MTAEKHHLRLRARKARQALAPREREAAAEAIATRALALLHDERVGVVLGYVATAEEADPGPLLETLRLAGARVALPRVTGPMRLTLHWVTSSDELVASSFGVMEPVEDAPLAEPHEIDVALVPGVAFDAECNRIGYGGCFYDNLLPMLRPDALKIGLAFDVQLVTSVPCEEHDVRLDWVITPGAAYAAP
jgi:5-formyltetrahydrofolate cyclo-ligase